MWNAGLEFSISLIKTLENTPMTLFRILLVTGKRAFSIVGCDNFRGAFRTFKSKWKVVLAAVLNLAVFAASAATFPQSELFALYDLYNSTNGANWDWSSNDGIPWDFYANANPCLENWQGVNCSIENEPPDQTCHVISLQLNNMNLDGRLSTSIEDLVNLKMLLLDSNKLVGPIPKSIGNLGNLQHLVLGGNHLTGAIPNSIGNLSFLERLSLHDNRLSGLIPATVGNLQNLQIMELFFNRLSGTIPTTVASLTQLQHLNMAENYFTRSIPSSIGNLTNLKMLLLNGNRLIGPIPSSFGELANLIYVDLGKNYLSDTIPASLSKLTTLQFLYLYINELSGTIPDSICNLPELRILHINTNTLTGTIHGAITNLVLLQQLALQDNFLTGSVPNIFVNLTSLENLFLDDNQLTGHIPNFPENITELTLKSNKFTGSIPNFFDGAHFSRLQNLELSDNRLTGNLGNLRSIHSLVTLFVKNNQLTGPLTQGFSRSQIHLTSVQLDNNQFTGTLPAVLFDLPSLVSFSMVGSCLHGTLPGNICNATQLEALILYGLTTGSSCRTKGVSLPSPHNAFHGTFPSCLLQLPNLGTLLLSSNDLTGSISNDPLVNVQFLQLDLSHNDLSGSIPDSLQNHNWAWLDLSHNKFSGQLQSNLLRYGNRRNIGNFSANPTVSLSSNRLSGNVPRSLWSLHTNLSVLAGNLFECKFDKSNLPQHDQDFSNYQCASNTFDAAIYTWLGVAVIAIISFAGMIIKEGVFCFLNGSLVQLPDELSARLRNLYSLLENYDVLSKTAWRCATFCLVVLLPYYAIMSHYEGTHTYQYAYVLSAIYTSGALPFVFDVLLLCLLIVLPLTFLLHVRKSSATWSKTVEDSDVTWRRSYVWLAFSLANVTAVLGTNVAFVYVVLYQSSQVQTLVQILLSLFKLSWSMIASPYMIRRLDAYFLPQTEGPPEPFFTLQLLVSLFNNIAIPCLVVAAIDPNCFSNILLPPDSQTVSYLLPTCRALLSISDMCITATPELTTLKFTPPFTYSYQCSASFITSYAPTFIYMSISTVFLTPLLQYVLLRLYERLPAGSIAHRMVSKVLPRILKPLNEESALFSRQAIVRATSTMVTLLTQLGILLTFGAIFPPVALAMAVSITAIMIATRYKVKRLVRVAVESQVFAYLDIINAECGKVGTREQMQVAAKIIICYCFAFYTLFLFDTLGDAVGFDASVWVLIVVPLLPVALFGCEKMFEWYQIYLRRQEIKARSPEPVGIELSVQSSHLTHGDEKGKIAAQRDGSHGGSGGDSHRLESGDTFNVLLESKA